MAIAIAAFDFTGWVSTGPSVRYVLFSLLILVAAAADGKSRMASTTIHRLNFFFLSIFAGYLCLVYIVGLVTANLDPTSTVLVLPLIIALLGPIIYYTVPSRPQIGNRKRGLLQLSALLFGVSGIYDVYVATPGEPPSFFNHETAFIVVLVLCLPRSKFSTLSKLVVLGALSLGMYHYASASTLIVLGAGALTYLSLSRLTARASLVLVSVSLMSGLMLLPYVETVLAQFYTRVNRVNNTSTRQVLWKQALEIWNDNQLTGSGGSEPIIAVANIRGSLQLVPFHNSFLALAVYGGLFAVSLFLIAILGIIIRAFRSTGSERRRAQIWGPALVAGLMSMSVNPVLESLATALPFYALVFCGVVSVAKGVYPDAS